MEPSEQDRMMTIEWDMMDKDRFFMLSVANSIALRSVLYPLTVIKTRLQVQKSNEMYRGTFDAFSKIVRQDGMSGLYRGFMVNTMQIVSGIGYLFTYETVRHLVSKYTTITDNKVKGLIAGGASSMVSQTIITPFDVVSQHIMVMTGKKRHQMNSSTAASGNNGASFKRLMLTEVEIKRYGLSLAIIRELYRQDHFKGFYRGYFASLGTYVPSSAIWWMFYPCYSGTYNDFSFRVYFEL
jgi:solute carrier family 25 protein 44